MTLRFTSFYFMTVAAVHFYFLYTPFSQEILSLSEFRLTQVLNQSDVMLLLLFTIVHFWKKFTISIYLLMLIYVLYIIFEILFPVLMPKIGSERVYDLDYFIMILIRLLYIAIFIRNGLLRNFSNKYLYVITFVGIMAVDFFILSISDSDNFSLTIAALFSLTQMPYITIGFLTKSRDKYCLYAIQAGILVSSIVDSIYLYDIYVEEVDSAYTWVRLACTIGEFLLAYGIIRNIDIIKAFGFKAN